MAARTAMVAGAGLLMSNTVFAQQPTGADVVAGSAVISVSPSVMDVNAASARTIINWDSFSIANGNTTNFNLPDANSAILNRVTTPDMPSVINGSLNSNGHVHLVNPSGIMVGASGIVNTNAFVATTFDIANSDFLNGGALTFSNNGSNASIVNNGTINTGEGGTHLIANDIANNGTLTSVGGNITLSAGGEVTLSNGVNYVQPTLDTLASGISPTAAMIQNEGTIRATGAATAGGEVYLVNPTGKILHDGTIAVERVADDGSSTGGHVQLEADDITLSANSWIDATGTNAGGDVLVGGDWQGSGEMTQATSVTMEAGATIDASAIEVGDGGKIVLWSDLSNVDSVTKALGTLLAKGGELLGAGGQIETSGAAVETDGVVVNAGAANGHGGLWLIDPYDYTIDGSAATNIVSALNTGTSVEVATTTNNASYGSSGNDTDNGDITVASDIITGAMSGDATLTLKATRHIVVNAGTGIDATQNGNTQSLNVKLWADTDNSGDGINIVSSPTIATNGGSLTFGNGDTATIGGVSTQVGGDLYANGVTAQSFDSGGGDISVNGETILANTSGVTFNSFGGDIHFGGVLNSGNQYTYVDGPDGQANSWSWARTDARNGTPGGSALGDSYMVTITSRLENAVAGIAAGYRGAWIGAYRDTSTTNNWRWVDGPEAGQHFFTELDDGGGTAQPGWFSNFGDGEPNGAPSSSGETRGQFFGTAGQWNDLSPSTTFSATQDTEYRVLGYVRETNLTPSALVIDAGAGFVTINGGVGGSKALSSLNVMSSGVTVNGDSLVTTGAQTYNSALTATSTIGLKVGGTTLTSSGAFDFTAADNVSLDASLASTEEISITGDQIVLDGNQSINSGSSDLTLNTDDVSGGVLTLNTTGHLTYAPKNSAWDFDGIGFQLEYDGTISGDTFTGSTDVDWLKINNYSTLGGLTLGKDGNTSHLYVFDPIVVNGDVNLIADNITLVEDIDNSSASGADILLKASGTWNVAASGVELDAGSGDITVRADTFNWDDRDPTLKTTGNALILPSTDSSSFTHSAVKTSWFIFDPSLGGLQIGHDANTSGVTIDTDVSVAGPISIYGTDVSLSGDLTSTQSGAGILAKARGNIVQDTNVDITTAGGNVTLWSDSDNSGQGGIHLKNQTSIDTRTAADRIAGTHTTGGGNIVIAGGLDDAGVSSGTGYGAAADGTPDGYAANLTGTRAGVQFGNNGTTAQNTQIDLFSGGGNIIVNGKSTQVQGDYSFGVVAFQGYTIDGGQDGNITMHGHGEAAANHTGGFDLFAHRGAGAGVTIQTVNGDILFDGYATGGTGTNLGIAFDGTGSTRAAVQATGTGNVTFRGEAEGTAPYGVRLRAIDILSASGDINVIAEGGKIYVQNVEDVNLGSAIGSDVTSSTGDILLRSDDLQLNAPLKANTTGSLTVEPFNTSFTTALTWPSTNLSSSSSLGSLTLGKESNTADITIASDQNVAGAVNVYGGSINVNADINTTGGTADGDVLLKAATNITQAAGIDVTTDGGNVTYWSDSDASSDGYVSLDLGSTIVTNGGNIVIGGGADAGGDGIPDSAAMGQASLDNGAVFRSGILLNQATLDTRSGGTLDADAGNIVLNGTSTHTGGDRAVGVMLFGTKLIGDVVDVTGSVTDTGGTTTRFGISSNGDVSPNNTNIQSFGGITLNGNAASPDDQYSIRWGTNHEMSAVDGDISINSNGQLQYLSRQTLTLADTRSLIFNSEYDAEWRNVIAGDGGLIKQGGGTLELTRQNTYTGATTIGDGHLIIRLDAPSIVTSEFNGTGELTVESAAAGFSSPVAFDAAVNGLSALTVGKPTNTADITFAEDIATSGPVTVHGGTLDFAGTMDAGSSDILLVGNDLNLADAVSSTGALTIETQTSGTTIGVGTGNGSLTIDNAELANLQDGFSSITIGDTDAGALRVGGLTGLQDNLILQAGSTTDLVVVEAIDWDTDDALTLAAGRDVYVQDDIDVNGANATLNILYGGTDGTTVPTAGRNFYIDLSGRRTIDFAETTANLKIGNETYTLIDEVSDFTDMTTTGKYALANGLSLVGSTYDKAVYDAVFAGKLDGLGHAVDGMLIENSTGGNLGLFTQLKGATVRHLGVTNMNIKTNSNSETTDFRVGGLVGNLGGAGTSVGSVTTLDGVWSSGVISTTQGSQQGIAFFGGLVGNQNGGTMNLTRSYSLANVSTDGSNTHVGLGLGGLVGDISLKTLDDFSIANSSTIAFDISNTYSTGSVVQGAYDGYYGAGGLVGVIYSSDNSISDSYSWGNVVGSGSFGGIVGFSRGLTANRVYTTQDTFGNQGTYNSSYTSADLDTATNNGTQLPGTWSSNLWSIGDRPTLSTLPIPPQPLYVKVGTGTSSIYGNSLSVGYSIVDENGDVVMFGSGDYANLTGTTGSGVYTIDDFAHAQDYSVSYLTGLGLTGDDANEFILNPFGTAGSHSVTARELSLSLPTSSATKVYDGTTAGPSGLVLAYSIGNLASFDTGATINHSSAVFNAADVQDATTLTIDGFSIGSITGTNNSVASDYSVPTTPMSVSGTITAKPIIISGIAAADRTYDGTTSATIDHSGAIFGGAISGDELTVSGSVGQFLDKNVGTDKSVALSGATYGGADVDNYSFTDQAVAMGSITAKALTISGITAADKTYDGNAVAEIDVSAANFGGLVAGDDVSVQSTGLFDTKNVGTDKVVTLSSSYDGADTTNYQISDQTMTLADIARLGSVTWIGGTTGDWSDPDNWAGGAIPDLGNVENVVIPDGVTPVFDDSVAGPVDLESLAGGNLQVDSGTMNVAGDVNVTDFQQNGGQLNVDGDLDVTNTFDQTAGGIRVAGDVDITDTDGDLNVGNLSGGNVKLNSTDGGVNLGDVTTTGTLDVNAGDGDIQQLPGMSIDAAGSSTFSATGDITLGNPGNDFQGTVNASGNNVMIHDDNGGLTLGDIDTAGTFSGTSTDGPIGQSLGGTLTIGGTSDFTASQDGDPADILLDNPDNDFGGSVDVDGQHVVLNDAVGGLTLNNVVTTGDLDVTSTDGPIDQTDSGGVTVSGESSFVANKDGRPSDIQLANPSNDFQGTVNAYGSTIGIDDADGMVTFGKINSTGSDDPLAKSTRSSVRDTNTRYKEKSDSSGTSMLNVVQRYGRQWMAQLVDWLGEKERSPQPAITEQDLVTSGDDVFIRPSQSSQVSEKAQEGILK